MLKTLHPLQEHRFNSWLGNYDPACHAVWPERRGKEMMKHIICFVSRETLLISEINSVTYLSDNRFVGKPVHEQNYVFLNVWKNYDCC